MPDKLDAIPGSTGRKIIDGLKDAVAGNFASVTIEGQRWVRDPAPSRLTVWLGAMPESNGKSNFTAILHKGDLVEGHTIARSEYADRVRYEADRVRYLIGERAEAPDILKYDANCHSGYVEPQRSAASTVEPVAWRDIIKQPDERPLPTYGQIPWDQLGRDVVEAGIGRRNDYEFDPSYYPGHQMVLGVNFNSLARIVDKYRYYGLPCAAPTTSPEPDAVREKLHNAIDSLVVQDLARVFSVHGFQAKSMSEQIVDILLPAVTLAAPALSRPVHGGWLTREQIVRCLYEALRSNIHGMDGFNKAADAILALDPNREAE